MLYCTVERLLVMISRCFRNVDFVGQAALGVTMPRPNALILRKFELFIKHQIFSTVQPVQKRGWLKKSGNDAVMISSIVIEAGGTIECL